MKKILYTFLLCLPLIGSAQNAGKAPLTNADIIKLVKLDLPPAAIIGKIKSSPTHFDVSVDALVELKKQGVTGDVMNEMMAASTSEEKHTAVTSQDYTDPKTMRKHGLYWYEPKNTANPLILLDPTVISNTKVKGGSAFTYGIGGYHNISILSGAHSNRQIHKANPVFYFYLPPDGDLTPNEFSLVELNTKKKGREMTVGTINGYAQSHGISEKEKVELTYESVADGIYKVSPKQPLDEGEYCFVFTGSAPKLFSNDKVYDFGISPE